MELLILAMLLAIFFQTILGITVLAVIQLALVLVYLKFLIFNTLKEFTEKKSYLVFFLGIIFFVQASWLVQFISTDYSEKLTYFAAIIGLFVLFIIVFRLIKGKNYTEGKILLCDEKLAVVETEFDLLAFSSGGRYIVESDKNAKKGKTVKIALKAGVLGRKPEKILLR